MRRFGKALIFMIGIADSQLRAGREKATAWGF
jgi:hypothetical protein